MTGNYYDKFPPEGWFGTTNSFVWQIRLAGPISNSTPSSLTWKIAAPNGIELSGQIFVQGTIVSLQQRSLRKGVRLHLACRRGGQLAHWSMSLLSTSQPQTLLIAERNTGAVSWNLESRVQQALTHHQIWPRPMEGNLKQIRFGAFSQHGQLFNFRDWVALGRGEMSLILCSLRSGAGKLPHILHIDHADDGKVTVRSEVPESPIPGKRTLLLAAGQTEQLLDCNGADFGYFSSGKHAQGPARLVTQYGFARPERLLACRSLAASLQAKPPLPLFGDKQAIVAALARVRNDNPLANGLSFWQEQFANACLQTLATLRRLEQAMTQEGYLHPLGTPVALRPLTPAMITFHLLDQLGQWPREQRQEAVTHIAILADLLMRGDFYPHRWAMSPPEVPYGEKSLYRGMLNQNFHTDVYAAVGLAGCILPNHPRAARWRGHARRQFLEQMRCFVWPGGLWEESHTYAMHVQQTLLPMLLALRQFHDGPDLTANPSFVAFSRFFPSILSPRDPRLGGHRGIPPVGDHLQQPDWVGALWGWLANILPEHRQEFLWAWRESGCSYGPATNESMAVLTPLLLPLRTEAEVVDYQLPNSLRNIAGYGAVARRHASTPQESLLVVRCGQAWGHYHPDQGSFWWWDRGNLICGDSDLGEGELKFAHHGHNVISYPDFRAVQHLDRDPFFITRAVEETGQTIIECAVTTRKFFDAQNKIVHLPEDKSPVLHRKLQWDNKDVLTVTDLPRSSPNGMVNWNLHVNAHSWHELGQGQIKFALPGDRCLVVQLDTAGQFQVRKMKTTWWLCVTYNERPLTHVLRLL